MVNYRKPLGKKGLIKKLERRNVALMVVAETLLGDGKDTRPVGVKLAGEMANMLLHALHDKPHIRLDMYHEDFLKHIEKKQNKIIVPGGTVTKDPKEDEDG